MWRTVYFFTLGVFFAALVSSAITVYVFHDVDRDQMGHWNEAFAGLCTESALFAVLIGAGVALLTSLGRHLFHMEGYSPRSKQGLFLGIAVTVFQYPWYFLGRVAFPKFADSFLYSYLVAAIVLCSFVIVRDNFRQMRLSQASATSFDNL
jgi:hypothetical protein